MNESEEIVDEMETPSLSSNILIESVELGDVIMIHAPRNAAIDQQTYYVYYVDNQKLKLLNTSTHQLLKLNIDGYVADESITTIDLLSRSEFAGFAKQHKLEPPQWIDVHFGGDMPAVISGEITNLEEDMIEITTFPGMRVIYVDFAYQGIPENLPIDKIVLRERPKSLNTSLRSMLDGTTELNREEVEAEATVEFDEDDGQLIVSVPENVTMNLNDGDMIDEYIDQDAEIPAADGEDDDGELAAMTMFFEVPESERRYSEEMQVADLMGELVSKLAPEKRTTQAMSDVHRFVTRFKELRRAFSVFDANGDVIKSKTTDVLYKPLIDRVMGLDKHIPWLLPVVREKTDIISFADNRGSDSYEEDSTRMVDYIQPLEEAQRAFSKSTTQSDHNKYDQLMTAFESQPNVVFEEGGVFLKNAQVKSAVECIVANDAEFQMDSSVLDYGIYHQSDKNKFTVRRVSVGSTRMALDENTRRRTYMRRQITQSDKVNVRSVILLPRPVLLQSHANSPSANLYIKSKLAEIPIYKFRMLKQRTKMPTHLIENLDEEMNYDDEKEPFLQTPMHYAASSDVANEDTFRRFLNAILPRTRNLIRWLRPSMEHLYSFVDVVAALEPFLIESEDITFKQYIEIRYFIKEKIKKYIADVARNRKDFDAFQGLTKLLTPPLNRIETIVHEQKEFEQYLLSTYNLSTPPDEKKIAVNSSETLQHLLSLDGGEAYAAILNLYLIQFLTIPESVVGILKPPDISSDDSRAIIKSKCERRFLTKKYRSVTEMRKDDNTTDVFYDKEYDDTPYYLLDKYKDEKKRFQSDEEFREFFTETLIQKHDCPQHLAPVLANTILSKKKRVSTGEYAMLEIKPTMADRLREESDLTDQETREVAQEAETRKHIEFYKRAHDEWVLDKTVGLDAFIDTNTLFCELSESCNKITDVNQCVPGEMAALQMRLSKRARMMEEFEDRVARSFDEVANELHLKLHQMRRQIRRGGVVKQSKLYRQNNYSYELGKYAKSTESVVESPHIDLRERILGWPDFVAKQKMIHTFVTRFCRTPIAHMDEDAHWFYCKDTNTRLFPESLHRLAMAFFYNNYSTQLDILIRDNGQMSDDGDAIVDKYTGYVLRKIDFSSEEGFDEAGFRITTNAEVEQDVGAMVLDVLSKKDRVFANPTAEAAYNVFLTLSENMGIEKETSIEEFVLRISLEMMKDTDVVMTENVYLEEIAKQPQKTKTAKMPYSTYYNQYLIIIVSCATFAAMQTLIPSFKTKKTFPGCVKSFAGYPLEPGSLDNAAGLKYVACILDKSKRASSQPWSSIEPLSLDNLLKRMKKVMQYDVYPRPDVTKMYELKREYLSKYPDKDVPDEVAIQRWTHFMPPVVPFAFESGKLPTGISEEYEKELFQTIMQGSSEQFKMLGLVKGKLLKHGYLVYDIINRIVGKKQLLLATAGGAAYLENSCCNEEGSNINPIAYFCNEIPELKHVLQKTLKMEDAMYRVRNLTKAKTFFDPNSSRVIGAAIPDTIISKTIYETFIHYGNFDNDAEIPAHLSAIVTSKPEYNRFASLEEKIAFLKKHGKNYGLGEFHSIMRAVNNRNMVNRKPDKEMDILGGWKDMIEYFDEKNSELVEERLRELLRKTVAEYDPKTAVHEESATANKLKRYLQRANEGMHDVIVAFLDTHATLTSLQLTRVSTFLEYVASWRIGDATASFKEMYNIVYNLARVYPNKMLTNQFSGTSPNHWGFSPVHRNYLNESVSEFYAEMAALVDENRDSTFNQYLKRATMNLKDLAMFVEHIPRFAPLVREDGVLYWKLYSDEIVLLLHKYGILSAIHEYIVLANDREFRQMRAEEIKQAKRAGVTAGLEADDDMTDYGANDLIRQVHIVESDTVELKKLAAKWLVAVLGREMATKTAIDRSYKEIMDATMLLKHKDKKDITDYLANMTRDERRVEQALRSHKLGRWNVGMQKGLYQYEKGVYETEVLQWHVPDQDIVQEEDVEDLERAERQEQAANYDNGDGWENLNEEYMDGIYYEEDAEREDYDEY